MDRMVTILSTNGFRFVIYTNDHDPAHVLAINADGEAKINLTGAVDLVWVDGMKRSSVRKVMQIVVEHHAEFLARWEEIHG